MLKRSFATFSVIGALASATLALLATPALADVKYKHSVEGPKVDPNNDKLKPGVPKPLDTAKADSTITADKLLQVDIEISGDILALIEEYKGALEDMAGSNDPRIIDIGFRLAEAYAQEQRIEHSQAMEAALAFDKETDAKKKATLHDASAKHLANEKAWLTKAIGAYDAVVKSPQLSTFKQADQVIFYYAFTLQTAGYTDQALDIYKLLLKNFQGSPFVPDAYNAFADHYFDTDDLPNAEAFYTKVLQFQQSPLYPYALYRRAWVYYNQKRFDDAMKGMVEVVHRTDGDAKNDQMNKQAKKDYVRVYSDNPAAPVDSSYARLQGLDKTPFAFKLYVMLADYYFAEGKMQQAVWVYHDLMSKSPKDPLLCDWQYKVVQATQPGGSKPAIADEIGKLVKLYTFLKTNQILKASDLQDCHDNAAQMSGDYAKLWHLEGLKTLNQDTLDQAHKLYDVYLANFTDADNAPELQYDYAELLWKAAEMEKDQKKQSERFQDAAVEYSKCADMPQVSADQKKNCAYVALQAWRNALNVDPAADNPVVDPHAKETDVPKPQDIPEKEKRLLSAMDTYLKTITDVKDDERTGIVFYKCRIYWKYNHFDEAAPLCEDVLTNRPDHQFSIFAMNILLDSFNKQQKYDDLVVWARKCKNNAPLVKAHPDVIDNVDPIIELSARKGAEKYEKTGQYKECGDANIQLLTDYPNAPDIDVMLYNASACYEKAKRIGFAVLYRKKLLNQFPNSKAVDGSGRFIIPLTKFALGVNFMQIAKYEEAAQQFEEFSAQFGKEKEAESAMNNSVFFRKGLGEDDLAEKDTDFYVGMIRSADAKKAAGAAFSLIAIDEKKKDWDGLIRRLTDYLGRWGGTLPDNDIIAHVKMGEALWLHESCPVTTELGACIQSAAHSRALKNQKMSVSKTQTTCGDPSKTKITVYDRRPEPTAEAVQHFKRAIALFNGGAMLANIVGQGADADAKQKDRDGRAAETVYWAQAANFYLGEGKFEDMLRIAFPTGLLFPPEDQARYKKDEAKFLAYLDTKKKAIDAERVYYVGIMDATFKPKEPAFLNGAFWAIASAARIGMSWEDFENQVWTSELPKAVQGDQDNIDSYCDEFQKLADPLAEDAEKGYKSCLDTSTKLNWFNDWSKLCETQLSQVKPQDYPEAGELHADSTNVPLTIDFQSIAGIEGVDVDQQQPTSAPATATPGNKPPAPTPAGGGNKDNNTTQNKPPVHTGPGRI